MALKGSGEGYVFYNKQRNRWNAQYREYDINTGKLQVLKLKKMQKST